MSSRSISQTEAVSAVSLADLLARVAASDLPERKRQELSGQVEYDAPADAWHVVNERRNHCRGQHIDRPPGKSLAQQANDRVTAHEVADPHVGDDKDGTAGAHGRITAKTSPCAQPGRAGGRSKAMTCVSRSGPAHARSLFLEGSKSGPTPQPSHPGAGSDVESRVLAD